MRQFTDRDVIRLLLAICIGASVAGCGAREPGQPANATDDALDDALMVSATVTTDVMIQTDVRIPADAEFQSSQQVIAYTLQYASEHLGADDPRVVLAILSRAPEPYGLPLDTLIWSVKLEGVEFHAENCDLPSNHAVGERCGPGNRAEIVFQAIDGQIVDFSVYSD